MCIVLFPFFCYFQHAVNYWGFPFWKFFYYYTYLFFIFLEETITSYKAQNDDLSSTLTVHQVADTRSIIDCLVNDPDAILQIMFSGRHISVNVNWTIKGRSSLCYLMNGLILMKGRRLGPKYNVSMLSIITMTLDYFFYPSNLLQGINILRVISQQFSMCF